MNRKIIAALAVLALALSACTTEPLTSSDKPTETPRSAATATPDPTPVYVADVDDWDVTLKITDKQCFGSAGCVVEAKPKVQYVAHTPRPEEGVVTLTFKVVGDESGPIIQTVDIDLTDGTFSNHEVRLSTRGTNVKPRAKVTEVEYESV